MEKPEENTTFARHKHRQKNNIKTVSSRNRLGGSEQDCSCVCDKWRVLVNAVMNLWDYLPSSQLPTGGLQIKKKLKATSELWAPEGCHKARPIPRTHRTKFSYQSDLAPANCAPIVYKILVRKPQRYLQSGPKVGIQYS